VALPGAERQAACLAWATTEDTTIAPENKTKPTPQFGNVTVVVGIHPARFGNVADVFSEVDDSTLIIVRSDKCSPAALRPQSSEVRVLLPGGRQKTSLAAIEFGRHERAPASFPQN
jgi:hypothetical protein